jgi:hypothetical protein
MPNSKDSQETQQKLDNYECENDPRKWLNKE